MALNIFIVVIITFSILLTQFDFSQEQKKDNYKNIVQVSFDGSTMYIINEKEVSQIVQSRQALNYKDRDEFYDATIILKKNLNTSDTISAEYILKKEDIYKLYQNVYFDNSNNIQFQTDYLQYDSVNRIASNDSAFKLTYNDSQLEGKNFYFDGVNDIMKADESHFIISQGDLIK